MATASAPPSASYLWAAHLLLGLQRSGVEHVFLGPGSRSTPLVVSAAALGFKMVVHPDERSAAFLALGAARALRKPALWITTSGSAVANGHPAVMEAFMDEVPLLLITADRPIELHHVGANQTAPQEHIFSPHVHWQVQVPAPDATVSPRFLSTLAERAAREATAPTRSGPVHINMAFREPFGDAVAASAAIAAMKRQADPSPSTALQLPISTHRTLDLSPFTSASKPLVIVGRLPNPAAARWTEDLIRRTGAPALCDIGSMCTQDDQRCCLTHLDRVTELSPDDTPNALLIIGDRPVSKHIWTWIEAAECPIWHLSSSSAPLDPMHSGITHATITYAEHITTSDPTAVLPAWYARWQALRTQAVPHAPPDPPEIPKIVSHIQRSIAPHQLLYLASSMTVRYFDRYGTLGREPVWIGMNRGVSGIDGTLATALGMSMALDVPATIVLGDLAMIYDLNALTLRPQTQQPITVIVLNDGGGSIFERLPIAHHGGVFGPYFRADHAFQFADVAHALGWEAISVRGAQQLEEALNGRDQHGSYFVNVALQ